MFAILLGVVSLIMLLAAFDKDRLENERLLQQTDLVFGVSGQAVLLLAAGYYFLVGVFLLVASEPVVKALLMVWLTSIYLSYRLGLGWLAHTKPCALITLMAHKMGVIPKSADHLMAVLFLGCLFLGSAMLIMERQRLKEFHKTKFMERYRQFRERGIPLSK